MGTRTLLLDGNVAPGTAQTITGAIQGYLNFMSTNGRATLANVQPGEPHRISVSADMPTDNDWHALLTAARQYGEHAQSLRFAPGTVIGRYRKPSRGPATSPKDRM